MEKGESPGRLTSQGNNEHSGSFSFMFFHFRSFSFIFVHCFCLLFFSSFFSFLLVLLYFLGAQKPLFFASIASRFPIKALMEKINFFGPSRGGPFFFFSCLFFFSFFSFVFPFFILHSFIFLLFFLFGLSSFFVLFLFFLSRAQNLQDSLGNVHILSWLYFVLARRHFSLWNSAHSGDDQVENRKWWAAGGSSPTFVPESPD